MGQEAKKKWVKWNWTFVWLKALNNLFKNKQKKTNQTSFHIEILG